MTKPAPIPDALHQPGDLLGSLQPHHLVYFLCNVGDGDAQVVLLPEDPVGRRQVVIVDAASSSKVKGVITALAGAGLLPPPQPQAGRPDGSIPLVVGSHPHSDHIAGMAEVLETFSDRVAEFWDPGYFHTSSSYHQMMTRIEANPFLTYAQPTAGYRRWIGAALITVLSPAIGLRNRFDTYGVEVNDSSISLRLEFPAARVVQRNDQRELIEQPNTMALILGADAQTLSWSYVLTDFPELRPQDSPAARALKATTGADTLKARVLKVSHHASKHGVNLELVERIKPAMTLVSSVGGGGSYNFPHTVAQDVIREGLEARASSGQAHRPDHELGIFYTSDRTAGGDVLGSMAVVMSKGRATLWRLGDSPDQAIGLGAARRFTG